MSKVEVTMIILNQIITFPVNASFFGETSSISLIDHSRLFAILLSAICLLCMSNTVLAQTQLGADIDGEAAYDESGAAVALSSDGNRLAIGADGNDGNGFNSGHVRVNDVSMFNNFKINPGLNDAWYDPVTDGQGFFITVFPYTGVVALAWFTYDTEPPPEDAQANLGYAGHRWITALGPITENQVVMEIEITSNGIFDTPTDVQRTDPPGSDGTIILTFDSCNSGTVEYDITSINRRGIVPIQRIASDNIVLCEALNAD